MLVIARHQIQASDLVTGNQSLDLIKNCHRIKRAHLRFQAVRLQPDCVPVGFPGLRAPRLAHIGRLSTSEGNKLTNFEAHGIRYAHDHFEI